MYPTATFCGFFIAAFVLHELGHVVYAKRVGVYKTLRVLTLRDVVVWTAHKKIGLLPLGVCVETYLEEETVEHRMVNCLVGILFGGVIVWCSYFMLRGFEYLALMLCYFVGGCLLDFVSACQVCVIGMKKGFETKMSEVC
jgi:Zn-dependent protease